MLARDVNAAPDVLRSESPATGQDDADVPVMFRFAKALDRSHPSAAPMRMLSAEKDWKDAPELGSGAMVADQYSENLLRIQKGLRATRRRSATLARYQESRIGHFHETLDGYMAE